LRYSDELPVDVEPYDSRLRADPREERVELTNFLLLAAHQVFLRVGWIFKTESIVMPVFMDYIGGGPVMRAMLMVLNRVGFSIPPVVFSRQLKIARRKKWLFAACSFGMAVPFALLALLWHSGYWRDERGLPQWWMPAVFLLLYGVFFALTGMNQLSAHALQGKVVRATLRGRLFTTSVVAGAPLAIGAAWWFMPGWLAHPDAGFGAIFACSAIAFTMGGVASLAIQEEPDDFRQARSPLWQYFRHSWQVIQRDASARALALLAVLFSATFMLFPHYVAVVNEHSDFNLRQMTLWVCVQNAGTAALSLVVGPLADRYGNRAALHLTMAGVAMAPLIAVISLMGSSALRTDHSWIMFVTIGFTPVTIRLLANYSLEIAPRHDHPKYVSALGLCLALPVIVGAPLVGVVARWIGYLPVFAVGFVLLALAVGQTFRIAEPRHGDSSVLIKAGK
jgi:hypothetical protein